MLNSLGKVQAGTTTLGACTFWVGGTHPWRGYNNMGRYIDMGTVSDIRSRKKDDIIVGTSKYDTSLSPSNSSSILHNSSKKRQSTSCTCWSAHTFVLLSNTTVTCEDPESMFLNSDHDNPQNRKTRTLP
jgi:hypothetical protein